MSSSTQYRVDITVLDLFEYADSSSLMVKKGTELEGEGHVLKIGFDNLLSEGSIQFFGVVLSSMKIKSHHEVKVTTAPEFKDWNSSCTCKHGRGKCAHQFAVFLKLIKK